MKPVIALALVLMLAACTPTAESAETTTPSPTASVTRTVTPTPTPTPTPTVPTKPALGDIVISKNGLGPVPIGTDLASLDPAVSIFASETVDCGGEGQFIGWSANYPDRPLGNTLRAFESGAQPDGFSYVVVYGSGPHTAAGIEVGDLRGALLAAYPGIELFTSGAGRDRYVINGSPAVIFFDVAQSDSSWPVDTITAIGLAQAGNGLGAPSFHPPGSCG